MQYYILMLSSSCASYTPNRVVVTTNTKNKGNIYLETHTGECSTWELTNSLEVSEKMVSERFMFMILKDKKDT